VVIDTVSFWVSSNVARKAFAAAVTSRVVAPLDALLEPPAEALVAVDGAVAVPGTR
jgi:hypothetical protein